MQSADLPANEVERLRSLHALDVLDSAHEREFDALVKAAALACGVPISLVSLVDANRQWFKASTGLPGVEQTPRDVAFCAHAILSEGIFEVPDATADPRFADNPLVSGNPDIRFYAGATLRLSDGAPVGTLCVIDRVPRQLTPVQRELLSHLASAAVAALESRRRARDSVLSEARFRALSDASPLGVFATDAQGACTYTNARWQAIYGMPLAQSLGHGWAAALHPDDRDAVLAEWARTAALQRDFDMDFRVRHDDGVTLAVHCLARPVQGADGLPSGHVGTVEDISGRQQQELELRRQQELLSQTGRLAQVGGWELDVATRQLRWSEEIFRLHGLPLGYQPDLASAINFYAPPARPLIAAAVELAMTQGQAWDLELPLLRANGSQTWVHTVGWVECVGDRPTRIWGAVQDISDRHAMQVVLDHKTAELKRSNEELERFAYITSHDLQEPLRMVSSYGQLLTRRHLADLKPEAQEFVAYMVDGGQRAQALIRDLLSLARLDSRAKPWTPVSLEDTLAEVLHPLRQRIQQTGAQLSHGPLPNVVGDAAQLGQLLANLLGNALKFCGKAVPQVHVAALREGSGWRISVRDNGIGIEPRYFERIFQMFQRLHLRTEFEGTGIGLAICKKVVERHGGHMGVESVPGQGSTFFFTLPDHALGAPAGAATNVVKGAAQDTASSEVA